MKRIKELAQEALALQNKNRMEEVLREIIEICEFYIDQIVVSYPIKDGGIVKDNFVAPSQIDYDAIRMDLKFDSSDLIGLKDSGEAVRLTFTGGEIVADKISLYPEESPVILEDAFRPSVSQPNKNEKKKKA